MSDGDDRQPSGWTCAALGDVAAIIRGITFPASEKRSTDGRGLVACLRTSNVQQELDWDDMLFVDERFVRREDQWLHEGDTLISMANSSELVGKVAYAGTVPERTTFGGFLAAIRPRGIDAKFLFHLLRSHRVQEAIRRTASRTVNIANISLKGIAPIRLPIPPLAEQRRIVAKLDELLARGCAAREALDAVPALLERHRESILAAAFREVLSGPYPSRQLAALVPSGRTITYGVVQTGAPTPGGVPTVRCGDIKRFSVAVGELKLVAPEIEAQYPRTRLQGGEVLIAIRGSVGETAVAPPSLSGANVSREVAVVPLAADADPNYVMYLLASPAIRAAINGQVKGVAQAGINIADLRRIEVPLPDLGRQRILVASIQRALDAVERLRAHVVGARERIDMLESAALTKAFRGELVNQDPSEEPASALLARLKAKGAECATRQSSRRPHQRAS